MRPDFAARAVVVCGLSLLTIYAQTNYDREASAQDYIRFLALELDQWTASFPHDYNAALLRPPIDAAKLPESATSGATDLRDSLTRLKALASAKDLLTSAEFRAALAKALTAATQVNQAMGNQRFPASLYSDWDQVRTNLNNLARIYKVETLAVLEPPSAGGGSRGAKEVAASAGGLRGYIVDQQCATRGKAMWVNADCVARCIREGDKVVLVTEEGKVYQIANPDKVETDTYGQKVTITGKTSGDTVTVDSLRI
jgi:hypothetical protein